jgi:hypothetical protein
VQDIVNLNQLTLRFEAEGHVERTLTHFDATIQDTAAIDGPEHGGLRRDADGDRSGLAGPMKN